MTTEVFETEQTIACPECGHHLHISVDYSNGDQDFFEECPNCCHEFHVKLHIDELNRKLQININSDDEQLY
ncbi:MULTISPECIES: CPXCG motif-containing cysteine-rich protein [Alteromonadaceae]|uniref:CPXCG motif-containing cysteine-rich protein n=1 Tax=Alteromonadaceae TaxID=72275 RepID=UPI001C088A34|nr:MULTISPECIES: CPXCG motif-containing cysteine-rich protein [Aliiglaciecola]MBU2877007.1 CPXCG motif-containing cysteine-rich protein [Aliiglaciecola lipolytica]MDO6712298.1 CPXCG motif-containing cysteine-rich protein [Aliiglaciecola sp. 2_MG-2023]MDO6753296.1 CPXCG motif-containing cysteine-rich protein [Aliiglaciecola sp. 1_MG-2023]